MKKTGVSKPCPDEYIGMILMVRSGLCAAPRWSEMSRLDQHILMRMLDIEADMTTVEHE